MSDIQNILERLGYRLNRESSKYWRSKPLYRKSDNPTSLRIDRETGYFWDWSANISGHFDELVRLSLGLSALNDAKKWLNTYNFSSSISTRKPSLEIPKKFELSFVESLQPNYKFYKEKGISESLLRRLRCGVKMDGKQNNRIVFPIFDEEEESVVGLAGRDLLNRDIKWKLQGKKTDWVYPAFLTRNYIEDSKEIVLVESIGDFLSLAEAGFPQSIVLFGVKLSAKLLNWLTVCGAKRIIVSTNNDTNKKENVGKVAAEKISEKLQKFINPSDIEIALPERGDFGDTPRSEIQNWGNKFNLKKYEKLSF